jgi:hypothetical protein
MTHFTTCWRWNRNRIPKRRLLILRRRGNTQKTIYHNIKSLVIPYVIFIISWRMRRSCRLRLKCDGTRAETRFHLSAIRTNPFKSAGGRQFSRLLTAEVCASAAVMLDTPRSEVVWRVLATNSFRQFPLHYPGQVRKISSPTGIWSPDRPACSQSLYWLSYPAHILRVILAQKPC